MIVYPAENYNSFVSKSEANSYFSERLYSDDYINIDGYSNAKEKALVTAFHSICELDITIDPTDTVQLQALKRAQCEQALYELKNNIENQFSYLATAGMMMSKKELPRYSERAMAILRPYITAGTVSRIR